MKLFLSTVQEFILLMSQKKMSTATAPANVGTRVKRIVRG